MAACWTRALRGAGAPRASKCAKAPSAGVRCVVSVSVSAQRVAQARQRALGRSGGRKVIRGLLSHASDDPITARGTTAP